MEEFPFENLEEIQELISEYQKEHSLTVYLHHEGKKTLIGDKNGGTKRLFFDIKPNFFFYEIYHDLTDDLLKRLKEKLFRYSYEIFFKRVGFKLDYIYKINEIIANEDFERAVNEIILIIKKIIPYKKIKFVAKDEERVLIESEYSFSFDSPGFRKVFDENIDSIDIYLEIVFATEPSEYNMNFLTNVFTIISSKLKNKMLIKRNERRGEILVGFNKLHSEIEKEEDMLKIFKIIKHYEDFFDASVEIGVLVNNQIFVNYFTKERSALKEPLFDNIRITRHNIYAKLRMSEKLTFLLKITTKNPIQYSQLLREERVILEQIIRNRFLSNSLRNINKITKEKVKILNTLYNLNKTINKKNPSQNLLIHLKEMLRDIYHYESFSFLDIIGNTLFKTKFNNKGSEIRKYKLSAEEKEQLTNFEKYPRKNIVALIYDNKRHNVVIPLRYGEELVAIITISSDKEIVEKVDVRTKELFINNLASVIHSHNSYIKLALRNEILNEKVKEKTQENTDLLKRYQAKSEFLTVLFNNIPDPILVFEIKNNSIENIVYFNVKAVNHFKIKPEMDFNRFVKSNAFNDELDDGKETFCAGNKQYYKLFSRKVSSKYLKNYLGEDRYYDKVVVMFFQNITKFKELDNLKSEFISNISHEFRTPLTSIKGYTSLLLMNKLGEITDEQKNALNIINNEGKRLTGLINDVLDISKLESGKVNIERNKINLKSVVDDVFLTIKNYAHDNHVKLLDEIESNTEIYADENKLKQILINLIDNGIKYNKEDGFVKIYEQEDNDFNYIFIEDSGIGISEDNVSNLFDKFYQVESVIHKSKPGSGLGLNIVKQLINLHGGAIKVTSKIDKGTTFRIKLPKENYESTD